MKRLNKLLLLLASASLLINTSCSKDDTEAVSAELTVSGGTTVVVKDQDVEAMVFVTAKTAVLNDLTVSLAVSPANGEATMVNKEVVIKKGETSVSATVVFPVSKFPAGTAEMKITVTGSSSNPVAKFIAPSTDFFVKGVGGVELPTELTIAAQSNTINVAKGDGVATLTFTLNKALTEDLAITYTYDEGKTLADADFTWSPATLSIAKGAQTLKATITVPKGKEGKLPIKFAITNAKVTLKTAAIDLVFQIPPFPSAPVALCPMVPEYRNYALTKTFSVGDYTLTPEHDIYGSYGVDDKTGSVVANVSNGSLIFLQAQNKDDGGASNKYASVMWIDWDRDGVLTDNERIFMDKWAAGPVGGLIAPSESTLVVPEGTVEGKYNARIGIFYYGSKASDIANLKGGCGAVESCDFVDICLNYSATSKLTASLVAEGSLDLTVVGKMEKTVTAKINKKHDAPVVVNLAIRTVSGSGSASLSATSVTIPAGSVSASTKVVFDEANFPSGSAATFVEVSATSSDAEMNALASKVTYTARSLGASGTLTTYCKVGNSGYSYASLKGGSVGGVTLRAGDITLYNEYIDYSQDVNKRAHIAAGTEVKAIFLNLGAHNSCGIGDPFEFVVYIDWNKDGDFSDAGEQAARLPFAVTADAGKTQDLSVTIPSIPAGAQRISTMRIILHYLGEPTIDGCQAVESGNIYDVAYTLD